MSNPDILLPFKENRVYVRRNGLATSYFGMSLTDDEHFNLTRYGIHPEGIEIFYIDNNYEILSERPPLITQDMIEKVPFITPEMVKDIPFPPEGWKPPEGWEPPPGLEEALRANGWGGSFTPQEGVPPEVPSIPDNRLVQQFEKASQDAREQFENAQPEFNRFAWHERCRVRSRI